MKDLILKELENIKEELKKINYFMYSNPEVGNEEFKAMEKLTTFLKEKGFLIEEGIIDKPTAFKGIFKSKKKGANVAFLCEYDALPQIGHGCGHNMIGTMSVGAAVALSKVIEKVGGQITVLGTPAEETDGAKVQMAEKGVFNEIDVALILHPEKNTYESGTSLAMDAIQFSFKGKTSHAAAEPEKGINALDGVILTFNGINALRQHVTQDVRIHGIIKEGGVAANIVPDKAVAQFYVRAATRENLNLVVDKVKKIAEAAALATGAAVEISNYEISYEDMKTNSFLSKVFNDNLKSLGVEHILPSQATSGSIDMGNVSKKVPSIHPYIGIGCDDITSHSREFAKATVTEAAEKALIQGAAALAYTGYDVIVNKEFLKNIKKEFYSKNE